MTKKTDLIFLFLKLKYVDKKRIYIYELRFVDYLVYPVMDNVLKQMQNCT